MPPRERSIDDVSADLERLERQVHKLTERWDNAPFVRADLHNEQIQNLRTDLGGVRTLMMWMLGIMGSALIAALVAFISAVAQGRFG